MPNTMPSLVWFYYQVLTGARAQAPGIHVCWLVTRTQHQGEAELINAPT